MTSDEKIQKIEDEIYEKKLELANICYRIKYLEESIQYGYLCNSKKDIEMEIFHLYSNYVTLNSHKLLMKSKKNR